MFRASLITLGGSNLNVHHRWMDKENVAYPYNRILFSLKNEGNIVICQNMIFEDIMLSEIRQSQEDKSLLIPLIRGPYSSQIQKDKEEQRLSGAGGWGIGSWCLMGTELQFYKMTEVHLVNLNLWIHGREGCTVWMYLMLLNCVLKMDKMVNFMCILIHPILSNDIRIDYIGR